MKLKELTPFIGNRYIQIKDKNTMIKVFISTDEAEEKFGDYNIWHIEARSHEEGILLIVVKECEQDDW